MFKSNSFNPNAGTGSQKMMNPGTHYARVVNIALDAPPYDTNAYSVVLTLEGQDQGDDFQGIAIDKLNPALGNYRGQVAFVKSGRWPFSNYSYNGKDITRDEQIFRWVNNLAKQLGVLDRMNADNVEASSIEEYVAAVKRYIVNPELWAFHTIGGQEYFNEGYDKPNYRLFYPKAEGKAFPFSALIDNEGKPAGLLAYDAVKHIIIKEQEAPAPVDSFGGQQAPIMNNAFGTAPAAQAPVSFDPTPIAPVALSGTISTHALPGQVVPQAQPAPATLNLP